MHRKRFGIILGPLLLLNGCTHYQPRINKKSYHLNVQVADDTKLIDAIRVSSKKLYYDRRSDCTFIQVTVENGSDASCSFGPYELNMPLISQDRAEKLCKYKYPKCIMSLVASAAGCGIGIAGVLKCISAISSMTAKSTVAYAHMYFLWPFLGIPMLIVPLGMGAIAGALTYALIPKEKDKLGLDYMSSGSVRKVIFSGETRTVLLLAKGKQAQDMNISLQRNNGVTSYNLKLL
jgi:hypothetical protein